MYMFSEDYVMMVNLMNRFHNKVLFTPLGNVCGGKVFFQLINDLCMPEVRVEK